MIIHSNKLNKTSQNILALSLRNIRDRQVGFWDPTAELANHLGQPWDIMSFPHGPNVSLNFPKDDVYGK